jgi:outer membrane receptor protein involved in Fe transport
MWNTNKDVLAYGYASLNNGINSWRYIQGNVDYQRTSLKNKDRTFTLSYKISSQPQKSNSDIGYTGIVDNLNLDIIKTLLLNNSHSDGKNSTTEHTFQADYTTPFGKYHTVETGVKYIIRNNSSNNMMYVADGDTENYVYNNNRSSDYKNINDIMAAYLSYMFHYKDFSVKPGVRYEYTYQKVKYLSGAISSDANFSMHYDDIVPSITTSLKLSDTQNIRAEYNMRIMRPGISNLNPYFNNLDPMSINQGNSNLKSEKSHNINLSYSFFTTKLNLNLELHHSFSNDGIEGMSRLIGTGGEWFDNNLHYAPAGSIYTTYENIGKSRSTGMSLYTNWNPSAKARLYINADGGYSNLESPAQGLKNHGWNGSIYSGIQYTFPSKIRFSINMGGGTPEYNLQGKSNGYYYYSLSLNRSFFNDRFTVSANAGDFFKKYYTYNSTTNGLNFLSKESTRNSNRNFGISLSYRIGNLKAAVKKASRTISNDDVKSGGSQGSGEQTGK